MTHDFFPDPNNGRSPLADRLYGPGQEFPHSASSFSDTIHGLLGGSLYQNKSVFNQLHTFESAFDVAERHLSETQSLTDRLAPSTASGISSNMSSMKERLSGSTFEHNFAQDTLKSSVELSAIGALKEQHALSISEKIHETLSPIRTAVDENRNSLEHINEMFQRQSVVNPLSDFSNPIHSAATLGANLTPSFPYLGNQLSTIQDFSSVAEQVNSIAESVRRITPSTSIFGELSLAEHFRVFNPVFEHIGPGFKNWVGEEFFFNENDFLMSGFIASGILLEAIDDLLISEYSDASTTFDLVHLAEDRVIERLTDELKETCQDDRMREIFAEAIQCHRNGTYRASITLSFQVIDPALQIWIFKKGYGKKANPQNQIPKLLDTQGEFVLPSSTKKFLKEKTLKEFYASCNNDNEIKRLDGRPNRHGVVHGRLRANSWEDSLNMLIFAHTIVKLVANDVGWLKQSSLHNA